MDGMRMETGGELYFILFFYRTAFDYCDTECQIKRPHARRSMSGLFQKQHNACFLLLICAVLSSAAAASMLHTDGFYFFCRTFRNSSTFSDTALVFVSSLTGWRARKPWWRLWLKLILAEERQWFFQKTRNCCSSWWKPCYRFPVMRGVPCISQPLSAWCNIFHFSSLIHILADSSVPCTQRLDSNGPLRRWCKTELWYFIYRRCSRPSWRVHARHIKPGPSSRPSLWSLVLHLPFVFLPMTVTLGTSLCKVLHWNRALTFKTGTLRRLGSKQI